MQERQCKSRAAQNQFTGGCASFTSLYVYHKFAKLSLPQKPKRVGF